MNENTVKTGESTASEFALNRAKVLLTAAQNELERAQMLLQRKSTGPHNFQKRMQKAQNAMRRVSACQEAFADFKRAYTKDQIDAVREAAKNSPIVEEIENTAQFLDDMVSESTESAP